MKQRRRAPLRPHTLLALILCAALLPALACSAFRDVHKPEAGASGGAGISLQFCETVGCYRTPDEVIFIELGETNDLLAPRRVLLSKLTTRDRGYLLNVPPGRYAVVAGVYYPYDLILRMARPLLGDQGTHTVYFPEKMVAQTVADVRPAELRFMGAYRLETPLMDRLDRVQAAYYQLLERSGEIDWTDLEPLSGVALWVLVGHPIVLSEGGTGTGHTYLRAVAQQKVSYQGELQSVQHGPEAEAAFLRKALDDLEDTGWAPAIRAQLAAIGHP